MSKTVNCQFCGKELTEKFLGGDAYVFSIGTHYNITCCEECLNKYQDALTKKEKKRLELKLDNYKYSTKDKLKDPAQLVNFINSYIAEKQHFENTRENPIAVPFKNFYGLDGQNFWVEEFKLGWIEESTTLKDMVKVRKKSSSEMTTTFFTKDDITKIEYRIAHTAPVSLLMPFTHICSVDIRLNDEKNPSYRPSITRLAFSYKTLPVFLEKKSAIKNTEKILNEFKYDIGSNLPIVKVKKFK